jgi:hypothetical protein
MKQISTNFFYNKVFINSTSKIDVNFFITKYVSVKNFIFADENLDPNLFFKINRKYIINRHHIQEIVKHSSQKIELLLNLAIPDTEPIILSKKEINNFKNWLNS